MAIISVIGIGLDGADGLSAAASRTISQASVLVGGKRHLSYFPHHPGKKVYLANLSTGIEEIASFIAADCSVVVLASGDPLFFGLGRLLLANFDPEIIEFHPHVSSIQLAFSKIKIPWQDAIAISVHGRDSSEIIQAFKKGKEKIALLTDSNNNPAAIARLFLSLEIPVSYAFYVCENLGSSEEKVRIFAPDRLRELSELSSDDFAPLNVLILIQQPQKDELELNNLPLIGLPDSSFLSFSDRPGLITKKEIRIAILAELALQPKQIVWDIGAGTGSVSVEIARLCPSSQIYAIEKTSIGSSLIAKNSQRFQVSNIKNINGKAPESLLNLPRPNRIFIGGSGGNITDILTVCAQKILDEGIIVLAFATIEYGHQAINWLKNNNWQYSLLNLQISRSVPIANLTRFNPLNPITIVTATK